MLAVFKMDLYRFVRSRSFYVCLLFYMFTIFLMATPGFRSDTGMGIAFDSSQSTLIDCFYYMPRSPFFPAITGVLLSLFACEEYTAGFHKNIYPVIKGWKLILSRWVFFMMATFCLILLNNLMIAGYGLITSSSFAGLDIAGILIFDLFQVIMLSTIYSAVLMFSHMIRSKIICVVYVFCACFVLLFAVETLLLNYLGLNELQQYLPYVIMQTMPYVLHADVMLRVIGVAGTLTVVYLVFGSLALYQRDL